eukprot:5761048-Lingulodinium_polyedra.AAC.1
MARARRTLARRLAQRAFDRVATQRFKNAAQRCGRTRADRVDNATLNRRRTHSTASFRDVSQRCATMRSN